MTSSGSSDCSFNWISLLKKRLLYFSKLSVIHKPNVFLSKIWRRFQKSISQLLKMDRTPTSGHFLGIFICAVKKWHQNVGENWDLRGVIKPNLFLYKIWRRFQKSTSQLLKMIGSPTSGHFSGIFLYAVKKWHQNMRENWDLKGVIKPNLFLSKIWCRFQKSTSQLLKMDGTPTFGHFEVF